MKSVMSHQFSEVPKADIPRSSFDRSHGHKTTFDAGYLIPVLCDEVLPGDTFNVQMAGFSRMSTPIYPVMDNMYMDTQFFAVPIRLLWDNFQRFMGERDPDPDSSIDYQIPTMDSTASTGYAEMSLHDYMGIPAGIPDLEHSSLFHRAYNLIWNQWYRDQNLQDSVVVDVDDGPDDPTDYVLLKRGKRHDYFTSALPWPQKGDAVTLPLGQTADLVPDGTVPTYENLAQSASRNLRLKTSTADVEWDSTWSIANSDAYVLNPGMSVDLDTATAATINQLRQAFQVQKLLERDARGGSRYTEIVKSHFGVTSPDARLQRPEYLGGGSTPINVTPVMQTGGDQNGDPEGVGNTGAYAVTAINNNGFTKSFTEHCVIIGLLSVRADLTYQQGLNRMFSRDTRYDFYWPALSHIGEQSILNKEIYAQGSGNPTEDAAVFGYQERYAEYRYKPSIITGQFRSSAATPLDAWHLSQEFGSLPELDSDFIEEDPPIDRVIATPDEPHFILDTYFKMRCARPMPLYGVPGLIDHF